MKLHNIQKNFKDTILNKNFEGSATDFKDHLKQDNISAEDRLSVYQNNIMEGLTHIIKETYPITEKLVGDEFMAMLSRDFIKSHMPQNADMNLYGADFASFIKTYKPAAELPYLGDIARMEWAHHEAYYAADDKPLDISKLSTLTEEQSENLILRLRHNVRLIKSDYPLLKIKELCQNEEGEEDDKEGRVDLDIGQGGDFLLIYRPELTVNFLELSDCEYKFLTQTQKGKTIASAGETLLQDYPNVDLTDMLQRHLQRGIFADYSIKGESP